MPVSLSIKNVPDELAQKLRERAKRNHRSLQGEVLAILEEAAAKKTLTVNELYEWVEARGPKTASHSGEIIREDRDTDHGRLPREVTREGHGPTQKLTVKEAHQWVKASGLKTKSNSVQILREERDAR